MVQADVLSELAAKHHQDEVSHLRLLREIALVLQSAVEQFEAVAELNPLRRCHYLLARTYHQLGNLPNRNAHATKFRHISEFFDGSGRGQRSTWEGLGLTAGKKPTGMAAESSDMHMDLPSTKPSFMPSTPTGPTSWNAGNSPHGRVSARPASALGGSSMAGGAVMGTVFGEVSPFTYAFDAAEAAAAAAASARNGEKQDAAVVEPLNGRCPALAQLLAVAEATHLGDSEDGVTPNRGLPGSVPGLQAGFQTVSGGSNKEGVQTVIGTIRSLYPMTAVLSA